MNVKKFLINLLLILVLVGLVCIGLYFNRKIDAQEKAEAEANIQLTEIGYGSEISSVGYENANAILSNFVGAYNDSNGEKLVSMMNLVGMYIYSEYGEENFDQKYEEILSAPNEYEDLIIMQYSLQQEEANIIAATEETSGVELTLVENTEIEDTSKYLSKMTAKIRTVSESEGVDQVDELEFILLHRDKAYYIINYGLLEEEIPVM